MLRNVIAFSLVSLILILASPVVDAQSPFAQMGVAPPKGGGLNPKNMEPSSTSATGNTTAPELASPERRPGTGSDGPSSSPPGIVSAGATDTASTSIIGALKNPKVDLNHKLDQNATDALSALAKGLSNVSGDGLKVSFTPTVPLETSQSLSEMLSPLRWWVLLLMGQSVATLAEKLWPWVSPVGNGLRFLGGAALSAMGYRKESTPS